MVNNVNRVGDLSTFKQMEEGDRYLTQPGDTMAGVAESFGMSQKELAAANPFIANPNNPLPPGIYLNVPKRAESAKVEPRKEEQERQRRDQREEEEPQERLSAANLETVSNNPIANTRRNYELGRGELSLAALSLASYASEVTANPATTGKYTKEHLLSDEAFLNKSSMGSGEIQKFFHEKGTGLATFLVPDGRSAAQFIAAMGAANNINPQILLVLLQRDGGFITGKYSRAIERERLDWAFGLGANKVEKLRGFDRQIETVARRLRQSFNENLLRVPAHVVVDGGRQKAENAATMTLYQLTPRQVLIRLFYDIWHGFFGSSGLGRPR
jgi:hypothetical protein